MKMIGECCGGKKLSLVRTFKQCCQGWTFSNTKNEIHMKKDPQSQSQPKQIKRIMIHRRPSIITVRALFD
jgi:hypothetical protein